MGPQVKTKWSESKDSLFYFLSPTAITLLLGYGLILILLLLPLRLPIGAYYRDIMMYLDAAYRIDNGQVAHSDFFVAFGALPIYGFWLIQKLFPNAQPVLAAQYSVVIPTFLLLAVALSGVHQRAQQLLLAVMFILLALLPSNFYHWFANSGVDGFGIYNRQAGLLLYVLVMAIWWSLSPKRFFVVASGVLLCLFFIKITAFAGAVLLLVYAYAIGLIRIRSLIAIGLVLIVAAAILQATTGIVAGYFQDIGTIIASMDNPYSQGPLVRMIGHVRTQFAIHAMLALLVIAALSYDRRTILTAVKSARSRPYKAFRVLLRTRSAALMVCVVVSLIIESENTGSQAFAFLLPAAICLMTLSPTRNWANQAVRFLAAAFVLFIALKAVDRYARITYAAIADQRIDLGTPDPFRVVTKPDILSQANSWMGIVHQPTFTEALKRGHEFPVPIIRDPPEFGSDRIESQVFHLLSIAEAAGTLRRSTVSNFDLGNVAAIDFADLFPLLLGMQPVAGLATVIDPYRTMSPTLQSRLIDRWSNVDGILVPRCPFTQMREATAKLAKVILEGRRLVLITPCWDLYVKNDNPKVQ